MLALALGAVALGVGEQREQHDDREREYADHEGEPREPAAHGLLADPLLLLDAPRRLVRRAPPEDRVGEHVVVDLVAALPHRPQDARVAAREALQHGGHLVLRDVGPLGEVRDRMGDLRARACHQVAECARRDVTLLGRQGAHRLVQVGADDALRAAERLERGQPHHVRAGGGLLRPQAREHELEVGRLDLPDAAADLLRAALGDLEPARLDLVEDGVDERRLDARPVRARYEVRPALERALDRLPGRRAIEVLEAQVVVEQVRDPALEPVEARDRVLADRDQDTERQVAAGEHAWQRGGEVVGVVARRVVDEVLLELVEDQEHPAAAARGAALDRRLERRAGRMAVAVALDPLAGVVERRDERRLDLVAPGREDDHGEPRRAL